MFYLKLACKKLLNNPGSTLRKIALFSVSFSVIFLILLFLAGADTQMRTSIRNVSGDASLSAKGSGDDIAAAVADVEAAYAAFFSDTQKLLSLSCEYNSPTAFVSGSVVGVEAGFVAHLDRAVAWTARVPEGLAPGGAFLEAGLAESLNVSVGDPLTVRYSSETGLGNTLEVTVSGVFIGSGLLFKSVAYVPIEDAWQLAIADGAVNEARLFFKNPDPGAMRQILRDINKKYVKTVAIDSVTLDPTASVFGIYKYYNVLVSFVLWMVVVVFFLIIDFSNQNVFYMEFRKRRAELSTLLAFGMKPRHIMAMVVCETLLLSTLSLAGAAILTSIAAVWTSSLTVDSPRLSDIINAIGGPRVSFAADPAALAAASAVMLALMLYSGARGAGRYLGREVREIIGNAE